MHQEQEEQHHQRERHDVLLELGRYHLKPFHRTQHRNRRGDDPITIKQAGAKNPDDQQHATQSRAFFDGLRGQRQHCHQTAFAIVVGPQYQHHVFDRDNDGQRPENDGQHAVDVVGRKGHMPRAKNLLDRVQHTGADVAVNHANGAKSKRH